MCCWHKSPLNALLHYAAFIVLIYGLWYHKWGFIITAIIVAILGHIIQGCMKKGEIKNAKIKRK